MWRNSLDDLAAAILANPHFHNVFPSVVADDLEWRAGLGALNRIVSAQARIQVMELLLFLHFADPGKGLKTGATFERLADLLQRRHALGSRAVRSTLRLAQAAGLVVQARNRLDGRLKIYQPTDLLLDHCRQLFSFRLRIMDAALRQGSLEFQVREQPDLIIHLLARAGSAYLAAKDTPERETALLSLLRFEGGRPVLGSVIICAERNAPLPIAEEIARRFYISPTQVRAILNGAASAGLIRLGPRGAVLAADELAQAFKLMFARNSAFYGRYALDIEARLLGQVAASG